MPKAPTRSKRSLLKMPNSARFPFPCSTPSTSVFDRRPCTRSLESEIGRRQGQYHWGHLGPYAQPACHVAEGGQGGRDSCATRSRVGNSGQAVGALENSRHALSVVLSRALACAGRVKGFRPDVAGFLGYLIAHNAHHRGQITMLARQLGHPLPQKAMFGMWE